MTDMSRKYVMARRGGGGNDMTSISVAAGGMTYAEALQEGVWKINSTQQIGIATATEQGLTADRFPIRVIIGNQPANQNASRVTTAVGYWRLATLDLQEVLFSNRPIADTVPIENVYKHFPELDKLMWEMTRYQLAANAVRGKGLHPTVTAISDRFYTQVAVPNMTDVMLAAARADIVAVIAAANAAGVYPYLKISPEYVIHFFPHGYTPTDKAGLATAAIPTAEMYLNMKVNFDNLRTRYTAEKLPEGTVATAAAAIAAMFRFGLFETYTSVEFYSVWVMPVANQEGKFTVMQSAGPNNSAGPAVPAVGTVLDISKFHISKQLLEIGPGFCLAAGLNHYMHNHTTGGVIASGSLLSLLVMFKLINGDAPKQEQIDVTSLFYEALHPVNKRGIANLFFRRSRVTTHGRSANTMRYEEFSTDQFMKIRLQPQPAGAHKAYVCAAGLRRIIASGLAMFLDWNASINDVIELCRSVLQGGAEAHMGSYYYTGRAGVSQSSDLDSYMPEIACYMLTLCKNDTLTYSAHLTADVAARASLTWVQLMRALKGEDYSATDPAIVKKFLASQGKVFHSFDITKEETWGEAAETSKLSLSALDALMN